MRLRKEQAHRVLLGISQAWRQHLGIIPIDNRQHIGSQITLEVIAVDSSEQWSPNHSRQVSQRQHQWPEQPEQDQQESNSGDHGREEIEQRVLLHLTVIAQHKAKRVILINFVFRLLSYSYDLWYYCHIQCRIFDMTFRFQFIKRPKTSILETPEQAYLIIEGASTYHRMSTRKVNRTRCSSTSHYSRSSYCKK